MFIGHYGAIYAGKSITPRAPLWILFLAVQLLDVFWSIFVLLGIEKVRIVPGITATNPLDLYYMPYTHSLVAAILWSIAGGIAYLLWRSSDGWTSAAVVAASIFSHWLFDFFVHRPDLPLYDNQRKVGLGLWNHPTAAFVFELAILFGGMCAYLRRTTAVSPVGRYGTIALAVVMSGMQVMVFFGSPPTSDHGAAVTALVLYLILAAIVARLEKHRVPKRWQGRAEASLGLASNTLAG